MKSYSHQVECLNNPLNQEETQLRIVSKTRDQDYLASISNIGLLQTLEFLFQLRIGLKLLLSGKEYL